MTGSIIPVRTNREIRRRIQAPVKTAGRDTGLKRLIGTIFLAALAGCSGVSMPQMMRPSDVVPSFSLSAGDLIITGPDGFCVDPSLSDAEARFVVLGGCDVLSRGREIGPGARAVLTVSASEDRSVDVTSAAQMRNVLGDVLVLDQIDAEGVQAFQLASGGERYLPKGDPVHWQAVTTVNGYLVVMTALSPKDGVATQKAGGNLLLNLAQRIRLNSPSRLLPKPPRPRPSNLG